MNKHLLNIPFVLFFIMLLIFFYLLVIDRNPARIQSALLDNKVPEFEVDSLLNDEKFFSSKEFGEQIVIVNFFATWCKPCEAEHIFIKKFSDKNKLKIVGINYKDNPKKTIKWLKKLGNPYSNIALDKKGKVAIDWGVYGIPETFVVNSTGIIKYRHVGPITKNIYKKITEVIRKTN